MGGGLRQGDGVMKAVLPLVLTALLGLGNGGGAVAQIAPGDPAGNQTIPEKDLSRPAEGGTQNGNATSDGNQSLSDKLDKSGGVIKPAEGVDPQIVHRLRFQILRLLTPRRPGSRDQSSLVRWLIHIRSLRHWLLAAVMVGIDFSELGPEQENLRRIVNP